MKTVLFIGHPNSGKTTLFNSLSGSNRKVANYSGISVDTAVSELKSNKIHNEKIQIVDLPGIYSLSPSSIDEMVTIQTLIQKNAEISHFHDIYVILDIGKLESSLSLLLSLRQVYGKKIKAIFNKSDLENSKNYDLEKIIQHLGIKGFIFSSNNESPEILDQFIRESLSQGPIQLEEKITLTTQNLSLTPVDLKLTQNECYEITDNEIYVLERIEKNLREARDLLASHAIGESRALIQLTNKIDRITLHPLVGGLVFFTIFYFIFHALYTFSAPLMDLIDIQIGNLGNFVGGFLSEGIFKSFIVDGVIAGVGGVVIFVPQIAILFFLLSLFEQSGYIARASIITDKAMSLFGLNGKAFLPFMSGFACSVPAIMATRTISDRRERLATLMVIPLITCSARLPVYVLVIGTFIPAKTYFGFLNSQALAFFFLYFLGSFTALVMAKVFRLTFFKGKSQSFIIDLPLYQRPSIKVATRVMYYKAKVFLKKAGTIILGLSMLIWFLSTYPKADSTLLAEKNEAEQAAISLEHSFIGGLGKTIEPVISPLGFDWKIGVGLLAAFGARELFVSTMGTIYALGDVDEESKTLRSRIQKEVDPKTGRPLFSLAVAWSLLIFFAYACQCISTLAIVRRETSSLKYVFAMFLYMGMLAYGGSFITFNLLR